VLGQTFDDFELVIIDDDSPDETFAIAGSFRDPRVRCLRNVRNLGPEGNWNRCLAEAGGTYFKLLPQDDLLAPDCLQRQVEVFESDVNRDIALVFCARRILDAHGRCVLERRHFGRSARQLTGNALFRRCLHRGTNVIGEPGAVMFRRELAKAVGPFDATFPYVIDLDYWLRLLAHGHGYYLPDLLASFRVTPRSWSVAIGAAQPEQFAGLMAKCAKDHGWHARTIDLVLTRGLALANNSVRLMIYRFLLQGAGE
jgi:glycosyltransferase involved in cell wall biosynthesis